MRRLLSLCFALLLGLTAAAEDRVSWEITPRVTAPGQPFRLQIIVESDVLPEGASHRRNAMTIGVGYRLTLKLGTASSGTPS